MRRGKNRQWFNISAVNVFVAQAMHGCNQLTKEDRRVPDNPRQLGLPGFESREEPKSAASGASSTGSLRQHFEEPIAAELAGRTVWAIDAHSLIHQVFHAMPEMSGPDGRPVGAVFGFTRDILSLLERKPDFLLCAFDLPGKTFRHHIYSHYKADRPPMHEDLQPQIPLIRRMLSALGIVQIGHPGYEADDILATIARLAAEAGAHCVLVTNDKDCRQLISDRCTLFNIRKGEFFDAESLAREWGIRPDQVVDFQALVGDPTDGIPGVPLIGPKIAGQLLREYGSLENVLEHAHRLSGDKRRQNLLAARDQVLLVRQLVRLDDHVPLTVDWWAAQPGRANVKEALALCNELGFRTVARQIKRLFGDHHTKMSDRSVPGESGILLSSLDGRAADSNVVASDVPKEFGSAVFERRQGSDDEDESGPELQSAVTNSLARSDHPTNSRAQFAQTVRSNTGDGPMAGVAPSNSNLRFAAEATIRCAVTVVYSEEILEQFFAELYRQQCISVDTETTHIWPRWAELVGLAVAWNPDHAWYLPFRSPEGEARLDQQMVLSRLRSVFGNDAVVKVGHHLKYDRIVLRAAGIELVGPCFDTILADYLLESGSRSHSLDDLARRYLNHEMIPITSLIGKGKSQKRMDEVPVALVAQYAGEDAVVPLRLRPRLAEALDQAGLQRLFDELETPLADVLVDMEYEGVPIDVARLARLSEEYRARLESIEAEIVALAGHPLNIDSPKQLQHVLFDELNLPRGRRTRTGASTDAETLEELARLHPLPAKIVEYRQYAKLKSTYIDALPRMVHPRTGRVHTSFNQVVTATGRLSSNAPNLQNIPVRGETGREIRAAFVASGPGRVLLAADYSQIELRVLAHFSDDPALCEAFARDEDIHTRVAARVFGVPFDRVTPEMRRRAKAVNFGVIYGQGPVGLAQSLGIDRNSAADFIDGYFRQYPGIERFLERVLEECRTSGYARTLLGRRRRIDGIRPGAGRQRNLAERTAVNTVIQGSAADIIKAAMLAVHRRLRHERSAATLLLQIHDELLLDCPSEEVDRLTVWITEEMTKVASLRVPLKVDVKIGPNWADMTPVGVSTQR